ncbi:non-ribosomal peptide synthetase, partial [Actinoplanes italicus]|uniref:non-ribosomal peptide synthetase n=1 Tax=Actinoplanes italicus TaxID=113567 RepID=UPI0019429E31
GHHVNIGTPLPNYRIHLLDQHLQPVPPGTPGEIHVAGAGLAHGYHHQPTLTAERFTPDPFSQTGERLYRSGDRARLLPDGTLEYLGRTDTQLKIRGHRIEPAEIENTLTTHPNITTAIATEHDGRLIAYVIAADGLPAADQIREHLRATLPEHMIPALYIEIAGIPLNTNGKRDLTKLPKPDTSRPELSTDYRPPTTETERKLAGIWSELLGIDRIGTTDDFFDLGG